MKLTVKDRFVLLAILPREGDFKTLKYLRKYREALAMSETEQKDIEMVSNESTGMVNWNAGKAKAYEKEIVAKKVIADLIRDTLVKMDKEKRLTEDHIEIYEKFVGDPEEDEE